MTLWMDVKKYFNENAGEDNKLSWEEMQKTPLMVKFESNECCGCDELKDLGIPFAMTKFHFDQAQNTKYDWDPNRLNFREFDTMLNNFGVYQCSWRGKDLPHCDENTIEMETPENEKQVRTAIRNGISTAIEDSWPIKRLEINQAIKDRKLSEVMSLLYEYLPVVATTTHYFNPELENYCYTGCVDTLYEIEEMASKKSLNNKIIRSFWDDIAEIFNLVLKEVKEQGIDIRDVFNAKWNEENISYDDHVSPGYDEYEFSDFTLMSLMEKANPQVTKKIAAAIKKCENKD